MDTPDADTRKLEAQYSKEQTDQAPPFSRFSPAWERDGRSLQSFFITIYQVLRHPVRTFSAPGSASRTPATIFAVVLLSFAFIVKLIFTLPHDEPTALRLVFIIIGIFMSPIQVYLGLWIETETIQLFLKFTDGKIIDFNRIYRPVAYVSGATAICIVIPLVGIWIGIGLRIVLVLYAMTAALGAPKLRILSALLLTYVVFFLIMLLLYGSHGKSIISFITSI